MGWHGENPPGSIQGLCSGPQSNGLNWRVGLSEEVELIRLAKRNEKFISWTLGGEALPKWAPARKEDKEMSRNPVSQFRSFLYSLARLLGDITAISHGPRAIVKRIARRGAGKATGRMLGKLFR